MSEQSGFIAERRFGAALHVQLNRPAAINALNLEMIRDIDRALDRAETDPTIRAVVFSGAGERGFCAGGDVRQLFLDVRAGRTDAPASYFATEYALNARIAEFPKLTVSWAHGVCMGGGVGLAGHCRMRLVTDDVRVAMPETRIGFTPDVGGSWLLGRAPSRAGERLGLHAQSMTADTAVWAGFADAVVPADSLETVLAMTGGTSESDDVLPEALRDLGRAIGEPELGIPLALIDEVYGLPTVGDILRALDQRHPTSAAQLRELSPTALEVTLRSVRSARSLSLREALAQEQRLAEWFFNEREDSLEGIRSVLIDKDHRPMWPPIASTFPI
ncbi:MAG TPA: enoyl-CoA hydratase/isomerase family protein [Microbacteriaceae bacterium]|nr:enoyl-CoA hydratase/isomerase family protein [Microbacteriaceae bacterium]